MIYGKKKSSSSVKKSSVTDGDEKELQQGVNVLTWCRKNPLIVSVCLYVILLFCVGLSNHRAVEYYKNIIMKFLRNRFKFL
jgi:hypothetical protein